MGGGGWPPSPLYVTSWILLKQLFLSALWALDLEPIQVRGIIVKYVERSLNVNKKQQGLKGHPIR